MHFCQICSFCKGIYWETLKRDKKRGNH
jgi:hypothetical protein